MFEKLTTFFKRKPNAFSAIHANTVNVCFYDKSDVDFTMAALVVKHFNPDCALLLFSDNYDENIPIGGTVIILGNKFYARQIQGPLHKCKTVYAILSKQTPENILHVSPPTILYTKYPIGSIAVAVWEHFTKTETPPKLLLLVDDAMRGNKTYEESTAVVAALSALLNNGIDYTDINELVNSLEALRDVYTTGSDDDVLKMNDLLKAYGLFSYAHFDYEWNNENAGTIITSADGTKGVRTFTFDNTMVSALDKLHGADISDMSIRSSSEKSYARAKPTAATEDINMSKSCARVCKDSEVNIGDTTFTTNFTMPDLDYWGQIEKRKTINEIKSVKNEVTDTHERFEKLPADLTDEQFETITKELLAAAATVDTDWTTRNEINDGEYPLRVVQEFRRITQYTADELGDAARGLYYNMVPLFDNVVMWEPEEVVLSKQHDLEHYRNAAAKTEEVQLPQLHFDDFDPAVFDENDIQEHYGSFADAILKTMPAGIIEHMNEHINGIRQNPKIDFNNPSYLFNHAFMPITNSETKSETQDLLKAATKFQTTIMLGSIFDNNTVETLTKDTLIDSEMPRPPKPAYVPQFPTTVTKSSIVRLIQTVLWADYLVEQTVKSMPRNAGINTCGEVVDITMLTIGELTAGSVHRSGAFKLPKETLDRATRTLYLNWAGGLSWETQLYIFTNYLLHENNAPEVHGFITSMSVLPSDWNKCVPREEYFDKAIAEICKIFLISEEDRLKYFAEFKKALLETRHYYIAMQMEIPLQEKRYAVALTSKPDIKKDTTTKPNITTKSSFVPITLADVIEKLLWESDNKLNKFTGVDTAQIGITKTGDHIGIAGYTIAHLITTPLYENLGTYKFPPTYVKFAVEQLNIPKSHLLSKDIQQRILTEIFLVSDEAIEIRNFLRGTSTNVDAAIQNVHDLLKFLQPKNEYGDHYSIKNALMLAAYYYGISRPQLPDSFVDPLNFLIEEKHVFKTAVLNPTANRYRKPSLTNTYADELSKVGSFAAGIEYLVWKNLPYTESRADTALNELKQPISIKNVTIAELCMNYANERPTATRIKYIGKYLLSATAINEYIQFNAVDMQSTLTPEIQDTIFVEHVMSSTVMPNFYNYVWGKAMPHAAIDEIYEVWKGLIDVHCQDSLFLISDLIRNARERCASGEIYRAALLKNKL